jgi:hypothetical protein
VVVKTPHPHSGIEYAISAVSVLEFFSFADDVKSQETAGRPV